MSHGTTFLYPMPRLLGSSVWVTLPPLTVNLHNWTPQTPHHCPDTPGNEEQTSINKTKQAIMPYLRPTSIPHQETKLAIVPDFVHIKHIVRFVIKVPNLAHMYVDDYMTNKSGHGCILDLTFGDLYVRIYVRHKLNLL